MTVRPATIAAQVREALTVCEHHPDASPDERTAFFTLAQLGHDSILLKLRALLR